MLIPARQHLRCHAPASSCKGVLKDRRYGPVEKAISLLLPQPVKRPVAWCVKSAVRAPKARAVLGGRPCFHAQLLVEEPAQFIHGVKAQWRRELLPRRCFECRYVFHQMLRRQQADLPGWQRAEEFHMAMEERSKVHRRPAIYEVQEQVRPTVRGDADR